MGPGPSDVPERVLQAMARPTIGHLDPAFVDFMEDVKSLLRYAFQTTTEVAMPVSGPGTAGMEACIANLVEPGDTVIICINGVFGGRLKEMAARCGAEVVTVDGEWGRAVDPDALRRTLAATPAARLVAFVQAETSTGALSDAETLVSVAREHGCLTVMDAVTSLGGVPVLTDAWGVDVVYSGTQKCLSCPPGLSPVVFGDRAVERVRARTTPVQSWFMDLNLVLGYWGGGKRVYHHTAPINALYGLHEALLMLKEEGLEAAWDRHHRNHLALRAGLEALGLEFVVPESERLPQLNTVTVPAGVDEARVRAFLLERHGVEIGAGLGPLAGRIWRIGLMGHSSRPENIRRCLAGLAEALAAEGLDVSGDEALAAAETTLASAV